MQFKSSLLAVKDVNVSRRFYEDLFGLEVENDFGANVAFKGGLSLQERFDWLAGVPKEDIHYKSNSFEIYFETERLEQFVAHVKQRNDVELLHDVKQYDWGQRVVRLYDPDGHIIEVGEPFSVVIKRFVDEGLSVPEIIERTELPESQVRAFLEGRTDQQDTMNPTT